MKKFFGIICAGLCLFTLYYSINTEKLVNSDLDLASLISKNVANAEVILNGCRIEENMACVNGSIIAPNCDDTFFFERDNCEYPD